MSINDQYSSLSITITSKLSKEEKKKDGIFITPSVIIQKIFHCINSYTSENNMNIQTILEPACGTCEIVNYCDNYFSNVKMDAIEFNKTIFKSICDLSFKNNVNIIQQDFIQFHNTQLYDLIITNPPYIVCKKDQIPSQYQEFIYGRTNLFGLFIIHSISMIKLGGILAFILPKSFLNSIYYSKIRNHIKRTCKIINIIDFDADNKFIDTEQSTLGLVLERKEDVFDDNCKYSLKIADNYIFTHNSVILKNIFEGATTLQQLGLKVKTGNIVWNQHKNLLTNDPKETTLIYNTNLTNHHTIELKNFKNNEKFQYIKIEGKIEGKMDPVIVVNRGNGNSKYKLNYSLVDFGPYLTENHLNEIYSPKKIENNVEKKILLDLFNTIFKSFQNPKTQLFIDMFLGNNGLSKTELETIFPIYL